MLERESTYLLIILNILICSPLTLYALIFCTKGFLNHEAELCREKEGHRWSHICKGILYNEQVLFASFYGINVHKKLGNPSAAWKLEDIDGYRLL